MKDKEREKRMDGPAELMVVFGGDARDDLPHKFGPQRKKFELEQLRDVARD